MCRTRPNIVRIFYHLARYLCQDLPIGGTIDIKHIDFNVKILAVSFYISLFIFSIFAYIRMERLIVTSRTCSIYSTTTQPFTHKKIAMIAGGTGITPMIQALHAILGNGPEDQMSVTEEVTLLYGSRNSKDILGGEMLDSWSESNSDKFTCVNVLSNEETNSGYTGETGFIDKAKIQKYFPPASDGDDVIIFVCGPPIMYDMLCGPRNEPDKITGVLGELGYSPKQVYKF